MSSVEHTHQTVEVDPSFRETVAPSARFLIWRYLVLENLNHPESLANLTNSSRSIKNRNSSIDAERFTEADDLFMFIRHTIDLLGSSSADELTVSDCIEEFDRDLLHKIDVNDTEEFNNHYIASSSPQNCIENAQQLISGVNEYLLFRICRGSVEILY